jgi:hypothetical protein
MPKETSVGRFTICLAIADPLRSSKLEAILGEDGYDVIPFRTAKELIPFPTLFTADRSVAPKRSAGRL